MKEQIRAYHAGPVEEIGEKNLLQLEPQNQQDGIDDSLEGCFPEGNGGIVTIPNSSDTLRNGRRTMVRFSALPSDVLHSIGANSFLPAGETLTPDEREMMDNVPGWYGNDPENHPTYRL